MKTIKEIAYTLGMIKNSLELIRREIQGVRDVMRTGGVPKEECRHEYMFEDMHGNVFRYRCRKCGKTIEEEKGRKKN